MRISKIRLAGFKSFVDPTTLHLPGNLTAVVGPNGCGKSNLIDAVLWVLGESSAKHLRGDSMADVVFNGSGSRKPVGVASVELVFDNSDGLIAGPYAAYAEISIKRSVNREGVSSYFLNGSRCRRLDITNLFLGTGVGARSYAVIEQGMISRVVESKPEELRMFLEEAAGISKYKVRRKDTEHRVQNTRENLARLDDIRGELEKQLNHLQQQARAAERYQELKQEERKLEAELLTLRLRRQLVELQACAERVADCTNEVEAATAEVRASESALAESRSRHAAATDHFSEVQRHYYQAGATISRLQQSLDHLRENRGRLERELARLREENQSLGAQRARDAERIEEARAATAELEPRLGEAREREIHAQAGLAEAEAAYGAWQSAWDACQEEFAEATRREQLDQTRFEHLESGLGELRRRIDALEEERGHLGELEGESLEGLDSALAVVRARVEALEAEQRAAREHIQSLRAEAQAAGAELDTRRTALQTLRGRLASLEALQQAALAGERGGAAEFARELGLAGAPRLAERIQVEPGWEWALEVVLGVPLDALCVDSLETVLARATELGGGSLSAVESGRRAARPDASGPAGATTLAGRLLSPSPVDDLLARVHTAESLEAARALLPRLGPLESVVTRDGCWLGAGWVQVHHPLDAQAPVLERERQLRALRQEAAGAEHAVGEAEARLEALHSRLGEAEGGGAQVLAASLRAAQEEFGQVRSERAARLAQREQAQRRLERVVAELSRLYEQVEADGAEKAALLGRLERVREQASGLQSRREGLGARREALREAVHQAREHAQGARADAHAIELRLEATRMQERTSAEALGRSEAQLATLQRREAEIDSQREAGHAPLVELEAELNAALAARLEVESALGVARQALQEVDQQIREQEQQRAQREQAVQRRRDALEAARVDARAIEVRAADLRQSLEAREHHYETLLQSLPEEAAEAAWEAEVERVGRRIARLGPINLAAIGEFQQLSERKGYLDAQHGDLTEALATLEEAMRKIDRETRTRFKETYDRVNSGLQTKFPLLFGGGHAYLDLTGEDLLEAGVSVMARPPGKRNGTIHLLSGGEKALTAVALVFAIFDLNPAPFCLLDEVDAPLDDANVVRLCDMVRSMSDRIQFMFITHNKITMELAERLIGVTMQEPGVSRLVAVDVDEAVQLAATA